jgi:SAM-dependent methyltransferase
MLAKGREEFFRDFVDRYEAVRIGEGRGLESGAHLRALPFRDRSRKRRYEWYIRSQSYRTFLRSVVQPAERASRQRLRVLDLGSGVGWLAYRLALRGHEVAAVDLVMNDFDGLGAHHHYDRAFLSIQAEFERLPFGDRTVDLIIYNASFHYATDYVVTLAEALRVLALGGRVVIMDSPIYRQPASGAAMVREREDEIERLYRFKGPKGTRTEGFLTYDRLAALEGALGLRWAFLQPWYGLRWTLKPWGARLRGWREPARFKLVVGLRARE